MNFFGHAVVARLLDGDPRFVLGSMLPDFASMGRSRLAGVRDERVADGVACHHRTDGVFHAAPIFQRFCREGTLALEGHGVGAGTATAVAHVGTEMLLDGLLLDREEAAEAYRAAIALDEDFGIRVHRGSPERIEGVLSRLREIDLPTDYRRPDRVAFRLRQVLAGRPRLAMQPGDEQRILPWLERTRRDLHPLVEPLLTEVVRGARLG